MADNLTIPVATREVGGFHLQRVVLTVADGSADMPGDATNGQDVDVTRASFEAAGDAVASASDKGVPALVVRKDTGASIAGSDGDFTFLQVDANGALRVTGGSGGGSSAGDVAHDAADSGNPVKIGGKARASLDDVALVAANDRTDLYADLDGVQIVREHAPLGDTISGVATNTDGTSTECIAAQAAGVKTALTDVIICNSSASNVTVELKDGTTVKATFPVPAGGGVVHRFGRPLVGTAATAWNFDPSAAATTITCTLIGFTTKV